MPSPHLPVSKGMQLREMSEVVKLRNRVEHVEMESIFGSSVALEGGKINM